MACEGCGREIGFTHLWHLDKPFCGGCGRVFGSVLLNVNLVYTGDCRINNNLHHNYDVEPPIPCPGCGANLNALTFKCPDDGFHYNVSEQVGLPAIDDMQWHVHPNIENFGNGWGG